MASSRFHKILGMNAHERLRVACVGLSLILLCFAIVVTALSNPPGDGSIFLAVGRAILNGRVPYVDLYETKPPGIFYLAALAQLMGGQFTAQVFAAIATFAIFLAAAWKRGAEGAVIGAILAVMSASFSPGFYPEVFGTAFLCVYARVVIDRGSPVAAALCLFGAIFFKETYCCRRWLSPCSGSAMFVRSLVCSSCRCSQRAFCSSSSCSH